MEVRHAYPMPTKRVERLTSTRKHVLQDLEPYICTFPGCGLDTYHSQHSWFEHELLIHRTNWVCPKCSEVFKSSEGLQSHIVISHRQEISSNQVAAIVKQSRRQTQGISPSDCPLCDEDWASADSGATSSDELLLVDMQQFQRHLGHHLQQIALFSLPRLNRDQGVGSNNAGGELAPENQPWGRTDCGRGWGIISRKRVIFTALAFFLQLRRLQKRALSQEIDSKHWDFRSFSPNLTEEGSGWTIGFNPNVPRVLDFKIVNQFHVKEEELEVRSVAFSPDGKHIAASFYASVMIFDVLTCKEVWTIQAERRIQCFCFSPNYAELVTGGSDSQVKAGSFIRVIRYHANTCISCGG